jgi:hypothetical protein
MPKVDTSTRAAAATHEGIVRSLLSLKSSLRLSGITPRTVIIDVLSPLLGRF